MFSNSETGGLIQCPEIISAFMKEFKVNKNIYYVTLYKYLDSLFSS